MIVIIGRDIGKIWDIRITKKEDIQDKSSRLKTWRNWFVYYSNIVKLPLDLPLRRFLIFTGYYLIFVAFLMTTILDHTDLKLTKSKKLLGKSNTFSNAYIILSIFALSMLWQDLYSFFTHKSISSYFKFWRVYDMIMHLGLAIALCLRGTRRIICLHHKYDHPWNQHFS